MADAIFKVIFTLSTTSLNGSFGHDLSLATLHERVCCTNTNTYFSLWRSACDA